MDAITFGTFNCENLVARYRFRQGEDPTSNDGFEVNDLAFDLFDTDAKRITAAAIRATGADVLALEEVESLPVLDFFTSNLLDGVGYSHRVIIHGNDPRNIDIAILTKFDITRVRTWRHLRSGSGAPLFSRDLLEVDLSVPVDGGSPRTLTLFVNHLKSMMEGREQTRARRLEQVHRLMQIAHDRMGPEFEGNFALVGDFNDYLEEGQDGSKTSLGELAENPYLVNANETLPAEDRWTHYYKGAREYRQLDYIWVGSALYERAGRPAPEIIREGLPLRAQRYQGRRFDGVGQDRPKASDHCPLTITVPVAALT